VNVPDLGEVLFCHATPRAENECFTSATPEDLLLPIFADTNVAVVICGHTHMQFDRTIGRIRVANAGSVGMPFGEPGADWLLLGPGIEFRHTRYNVDEAAARVRATLYPEAEQFAANNILRPPTAAQMLEAFTQLSLKALNKIAL
jgi:diadenosine tetraphosphatase ApaH/serine/threonine PP2A family protein phosphatase